MRPWAKHALASAALLTAAACPRPRGGEGPAPTAEPELRIGLAVGAATASLGGPDGGELLLSEETSGAPGASACSMSMAARCGS